MALAQKENRGSRFDQQQKLRGFFHGDKVGYGLLDISIEDAKILAAQSFDEVAGRVGYGDTDVHATDVYTDCGRFLSLTDEAGCSDQKKRDDSERSPPNFIYSTHSSKCTPLESFQEAPARK